MQDSPDPKSMNGQKRQAGGQNGNGRSPQSQLAVASTGVATQPPGSASAIEQKEGGGEVQQNSFDQPIILKQPSYWSRAIMITIMSVTTLAVLAAIIGKVEEAVPATGKLEPEGAVQEVQAPSSGVVEEILVEDGDTVSQGDVLVKLDPKVSEAELLSLQAIKESTRLENAFYNAELYGSELPSPEQLAQLQIPPYYSNLTLELNELKNREGVFLNYMRYLDQLATSPVRPAFSGPLQELASAVWQQYYQVTQQIAGTEIQLLEISDRIAIEQSNISVAEDRVKIDEKIVERVRPLVEGYTDENGIYVPGGALSELQLERQESEFLARQNELNSALSGLSGLLQQRTSLATDRASALEQRSGIVASAKADARAQLNNIVDRGKQITSDINNRIIANNNRLAELEAQIEQAQTQLTYQEIRSPIDGVVFDVQPQVQGLVNPNAVEPVMKVVPSDALIAKVFLSNQDVGFVLKAMEEKSEKDEFVPVDVRIDSFPFSEFGDVEGKVTWIGDDALPPDQIRQFFHFPATIELDEQFIVVDGAPVQLQSGMSVSVNVKTRKRRIITLFTDLFQRRVEKLRER